MDYFLFTTHFFEYGFEYNKDGGIMYYGCNDDEDTLAAELDEAIKLSKAAQPHYPPGHPVYVRKGADFVKAEPGSPEAGHKRLPGHCSLQKL